MGDNSKEILMELGYASENIDQLIAEGIVEQPSNKSKLWSEWPDFEIPKLSYLFSQKAKVQHFLAKKARSGNSPTRHQPSHYIHFLHFWGQEMAINSQIVLWWSFLFWISILFCGRCRLRWWGASWRWTQSWCSLGKPVVFYGLLYGHVHISATFGQPHINLHNSIWIPHSVKNTMTTVHFKGITGHI